MTTGRVLRNGFDLLKGRARRGLSLLKEAVESEGWKGVKAQEEPDDKFQIIISSLEGPKPSIFGNPLKLATLIGKEFGDVHSAKKFRSGDLLIQCKSVAQREKFWEYVSSVVSEFLRSSPGH